MLNLGREGFLAAASTILCLGAHSDDIEIGCGGTILRLLEQRADIHVAWVVLSAEGAREDEARRSADRFLSRAESNAVAVEGFRQRFFPYLPELKEYFDELGRNVTPDLVLTHRGDDAHQDHRVVSELTANTFRDHLILEYEIPKYDGDLGRPNTFVHLNREIVGQKIDNIIGGFPSQKARPWFTDETFRSMARLRGIESKAPEGYAEGFYARKLVLL